MSATTDQPQTHRIKAPSFGVQVIIGLVVGAVLGAIARVGQIEWLTATLTQVGTIFVQLLRVVVVPLVLLALVVSISQLRKVTNAARLAVQTLVWFAITAFISVVIGIVLGLATNPGKGTGVDTSTAQAVSTQGGWLDFLKSIVPANFLGLSVSSSATVSDASVAVTSSVNFNVLQIVVLGIAIGAAALAVGAKAEPFLKLSESALEIFQKLVWWIIKLAPIGSAALIGKAVASYGWNLVRPLAVFSIDVYVGCALVLFAVYPIILKLHGLSIKRFFAGAWSPSRSASSHAPRSARCR